jgi:anti-sigma regulatory factor (Ser/Thr protein kinase)
MCDTTEGAEILLDPASTSPAEARRFARASGCTEHAAEILDDALLLISELVTNAVKHGAPTILLALECDGDGLRVRVRDGAPDLPQPRSAPEDSEDGRGLTLLAAIADAWGMEPIVDEHGPGKALWFELRKP